MISKKEIIEILKKELPYLKEKYGVNKIGLFGSFAIGTQKEESDIDIVVEYEGTLGLKFFELWEYLEQLFKMKMDVLTPYGIKNMIEKSGKKEIERNIIYV